MYGQHCEPPFWLDPSILFRHFSLQYKSTCEHSVWNFVSRIMLLSVVVGTIASLLGGLSFLFVAVLFGAITASVIVFTTTLPVNERKEEKPKPVIKKPINVAGLQLASKMKASSASASSTAPRSAPAAAPSLRGAC